MLLSRLNLSTDQMGRLLQSIASLCPSVTKAWRFLSGSDWIFSLIHKEENKGRRCKEPTTVAATNTIEESAVP
jgi:hypothetical protein